MTKHTDDQINEAIMLANQTGKVYVWETEMYRNVIKHLPDQQDDWQECSWGDILHTDDRVKAEYTSGTIIEGVPDGINDTRIWLVDGNTMPFELDAKWYRIPAPVVHPDPAEHPVIIDSGEAWTWNLRKEMYHRPGTANYKIPEGFADWEPADIVPKVRVKDAAEQRGAPDPRTRHRNTRPTGG